MRLKKATWYEIPTYWPLVEHWVVAALEGRCIAYTSADLYAECLARELQLWLALEDETPQAVAITRLDVSERAKVCTVLVTSGEEMTAWLHFEADVAAWAAAQDCDAVEAWGRKGWERPLKSRGYTPVYTIYRKPLGGPND